MLRYTVWQRHDHVWRRKTKHKSRVKSLQYAQHLNRSELLPVKVTDGKLSGIEIFRLENFVEPYKVYFCYNHTSLDWYYAGKFDSLEAAVESVEGYLRRDYLSNQSLEAKVIRMGAVVYRASSKSRRRDAEIKLSWQRFGF